MRSFLPAYMLRPAPTLEAALAILAEAPGTWRPFAGGTDLMVQLAAGTLQHCQFVNVFGLKELRSVVVSPDAVTLGGLATFSDVQRHDLLRTEFPLLCRAASETGGVANQNRGTLAGNIANGSPAADSPPALLVYDAELELLSQRGGRTVKYDAFHTGYKKMDLAPDELIAAIRLPRGSRGAQHYRKVGARRAQAISKVCFAACARVADHRIADVRLAFASVAPTPLRAVKTEAVLRGAALEAAARDRAIAVLKEELAPIDDIRSTARYRSQVAANLLAEFFTRLQAG